MHFKNRFLKCFGQFTRPYKYIEYIYFEIHVMLKYRSKFFLLPPQKTDCFVQKKNTSETKTNGEKSAVQGHFEKQSRKHKCTQNTATSRFFIGKMKKA